VRCDVQNDIAVHPVDTDLVLTASSDCSLFLFDSLSGTPIARFFQPQLALQFFAAAWCAVKPWAFASAGLDPRIHVWNAHQVRRAPPASMSHSCCHERLRSLKVPLHTCRLVVLTNATFMSTTPCLFTALETALRDC
jgi:WD40 repeat protein